MNGKTREELEVENCELKDRIEELKITEEAHDETIKELVQFCKGRLVECEDTIDNLRGYIKLIHDCSDEDRRHLNIEEEAHNDDIKKLAELSKSRIQREWAALERKKYLQSRYAEYRKKHNITESRIKANDDMAAEFGEKHRLKVKEGKPGRQLIDICKD